jgi:hypothetical protein
MLVCYLTRQCHFDRLEVAQMNVLRRLGSGFLCFLLLISLSVFGMAFLINSTILDPDFVVEQTDKLDMTTLSYDYADELLSEELPQEAEFLKEAIYDVVADQEPWLKEQFSIAAYTSYDYFLGKSDRFEINIPLDDLKANVRDSLWQTLQDFLTHNTSSIPEDLLMPYIDENYQEIVDVIPPQYLPQEMVGLKGEQLRTYIHQHYNDFITTLQTAFIMPGISSLILNQIQPYFDHYYNDFVDEFTGTQSITEDDIPSDVMENLRTARIGIGYFRAGYYALMAFMVLLVAGIILLNRTVKDSSRALGIVFLIYGVVEFAGVLFARYFDIVKYVPELRPSVESWLSDLIKDTLLPLQWFSLGILILGVVLIVIHIIYKPRRVMEQEQE